MNIGRMIICAVLSTSLVASAATVRVGSEDIFGPPPVSDRDFNDVIARVSGFLFHVIGVYVFTAPPGYSETPLPDGYFFDYATMPTGSATVEFDSIQSSASNLATMVKVGAGPWIDVPGSGVLALSGSPTDIVLFGMHRDGATFYSDPSLNGDGLYHVAVTGIPGNEAPEPGTLALIGCGLVWFAKRRRK